MIESGSNDVVEWKKAKKITNEIEVQTNIIHSEETSTMTTQIDFAESQQQTDDEIQEEIGCQTEFIKIPSSEIGV